MFTGIIKEVGKLAAVQTTEAARELSIACDLADHLQVDQSVSINGVCHTVIETNGPTFSVQSVDETLRKTTMGALTKGDPVNLEPSLRPDQLLDGHLVQGHVDGLGTVKSITREGTDWLFTIGYDGSFADLIVGRGSIAVNGISLTVAREGDNDFSVAVIPYTYEHTTMQALKEGDAVNLEFDILGKYVAKYLSNRAD